MQFLGATEGSYKHGKGGGWHELWGVGLPWLNIDKCKREKRMIEGVRSVKDRKRLRNLDPRSKETKAELWQHNAGDPPRDPGAEKKRNHERHCWNNEQHSPLD